MAVEIEAKLKVDSLAKIEKKLKKLGAAFLKEIIQRDYYLDDAKMSLTRTDRCLRLREEFADKSSKAILEYKGERKHGKFKKRLEVQTVVLDAQSVREMFAAIGYSEILIYEKKRRLWAYGGCEICLDELPFLGNFIEIEGDSEKRIAKVQKEFGLSALPHIKESYATLMEKKLRLLGSEKKEVFLKD